MRRTSHAFLGTLASNSGHSTDLHFPDNGRGSDRADRQHADSGGLWKVGGWVPVEIELRNDGPDITGELQISVQDTTTNRGTYTRPPTIYSVPAVLPRKSHKRLTLEIMLLGHQDAGPAR